MRELLGNAMQFAVAAVSTGIAVSAAIFLTIGLPSLQATDPPSSEGDWRTPFWVASAALGGLALLLSLIAMGTRLYRRHHNTTRRFSQHSQNIRPDLLEAKETFRLALEMLSASEATTRMAGVELLSDVADHWEVRRQLCVNILCSYLRLPLEENGETARNRAELEVRRSILDSIRDHLNPRALHRWDGLHFKLSGAAFHSLDLSGIDIESSFLDFAGASFVGPVNLESARIDGGQIRFDNARFADSSVHISNLMLLDGIVSFKGASFADARIEWLSSFLDSGCVTFQDASFSDSTARFVDTAFSGAKVSFMGSRLSDSFIEVEVDSRDTAPPIFASVVLNGGKIEFPSLSLDGALLSFQKATLNDGLLNFRAARLQSGGIELSGAALNGGEIRFDDAQFSGGKVTFRETQFNGATLSFSRSKSAFYPGSISHLDLENPPVGVILGSDEQDPHEP